MAIVGLWVKYFLALSVLLTLLGLRRGARATAATGTATAHSVPPEVEAAARKLLEKDQKIHAIKLVREASGMGLKEAKDWVEALPSRPPAAATPPTPDASPSALTPAADRLTELKRLSDAGLITPAEYEAKKAEILAGL
jgi:hypothetical protein